MSRNVLIRPCEHPPHASRDSLAFYSTQADLKIPPIARDVLAEAATSHLAIQHGPRPKHFCTYRREAPATQSTHNSWNSQSRTVSTQVTQVTQVIFTFEPCFGAKIGLLGTGIYPCNGIWQLRLNIASLLRRGALQIAMLNAWVLSKGHIWTTCPRKQHVFNSD